MADLQDNSGVVVVDNTEAVLLVVDNIDIVLLVVGNTEAVRAVLLAVDNIDIFLLAVGNTEAVLLAVDNMGIAGDTAVVGTPSDTED